MRHQRRPVHADNVRDGMRVPLLVLLPSQDAVAVLTEAERMQRLLCALLLRALRPLPGVPRAQAPWLRPPNRLARQHGEAGPGRHAASAAAGPHVSLSIPVPFPVTLAN
jgi:hypothetical protein